MDPEVVSVAKSLWVYVVLPLIGAAGWVVRIQLNALARLRRVEERQLVMHARLTAKKVYSGDIDGEDD